MAITVDQIDEWRQLPSETEVLEFKEAKNGLDSTELFEYCVAIGNEGGGHLVLGIENKIPHIIVGTKAIENPVGMSEKIFNKLGFRVHIEAIVHPEGKRIVVVRIPSCPPGRPFHLEGKFLMRVGQSRTAMSIDQLRMKLAEGNPEWTDEPAIKGVGMARVLELLDTATFFRLIERPYPAAPRSIIDHLIHERFIDEDRRTDSFSIFRLGAILLANDLSDFHDLARKAPRVIEYGGLSKIDAPRADITGKKGYAVGFERLLHFINSHLPRQEVIENALRKQIRSIPEIIVREVVANALIHQDLTITGSSVTIEIYSDRIEISNPGKPLIPVDRFIDRNRSRNEKLANLMRRMRICEERGSGYDKVVNAVEENELSPYDVRVAEDSTLVAIYGRREFYQMDREARIRAAYHHCALRCLSSGHMTNQSLRQRFRLPDGQSGVVWPIINACVDAGLIKADERVGTSRKYARYLPHWA